MEYRENCGISEFLNCGWRQWKMVEALDVVLNLYLLMFGERLDVHYTLIWGSDQQPQAQKNN